MQIGHVPLREIETESERETKTETETDSERQRQRETETERFPHLRSPKIKHGVAMFVTTEWQDREAWAGGGGVRRRW